jgi:phosphatidylserine decarboxylase
MTESSVSSQRPSTVAGRLAAGALPPSLGERAARAVTTEMTRHAGPKTSLLLGGDADSAVLTVALGGLLPGDKLTVVPQRSAIAGVRAFVEAQGSWTAGKVQVAESIGEADPADVVMLAEPLTGTAEATRGYLDELGKHLADGGVLALAVLAVPGLDSGATGELDRQQAFSGAGTDLVLRNTPPVRVHRLRYTPGRVASARRLTPAYRPSSVQLTRTMNIDSNGVAAFGIVAGLAVAARLGRRRSRLWLVPALAALPVAAFFRDPVRDPPVDEQAVLAASDGKVLSVEHLRDPRFGTGEYLRVAVFLSVLDVHVNRSPVAGRVVDHFVETGGYAPAMKPEAEHNVAAYTVLDTEQGQVIVVQRTGLVARRIVQRAPVGSMLARGERFGLIRFGSRTDVYLPGGTADATVVPGDKVRGGSTVIARWR